MHILIFGPSVYGRMASCQRIRNLLKPLLCDQKITASNLTINANETEQDSFQFSVNYFNAIYSFFNPISILKYYYNSFSFIKANQKKGILNIFYCFGYPDLENVILLLYAKWRNYKIVFEIVENFSYANLSKSSLKHRLNVFTISKMEQLIPRIGSLCFAISMQLVQHCNLICKGLIPVIYMPISVNIDEVLRFKMKNEVSDQIKIFYGGSFGFKDGISFLFKAFEYASLQNIHLELILTGRLSRDLRDDFTELLSNSPVKDKIKYLGCLPVDEYFTTMANSDILCMVRVNSPYANAGFPFKLGEYMASGNAIVATNVGDVSQFVTDMRNAILIEPESSSQISEAILMLAQDKELRNRIGKEAYCTALKHFDMNSVSNLLYSNLKSLIN